MTLHLSWQPGRFSICRFDAQVSLPPWTHDFFNVTRTAEETSVVLAEHHVPEDHQGEGGWYLLKVAGPLDFSLTGILASLARPLADAKISIFAISTYDTDYLLVKDPQKTTEALTTAGFKFLNTLESR